VSVRPRSKRRRRIVPSRARKGPQSTPLARQTCVSTIADLLDSHEISVLCADLESLRWTGRKGYSIRSLIGACLVKSLYAIPTWSRTAALIAEHSALAEVLGDAPSVYALYRFAAKLRRTKPLLNACIDRVTAALGAELPEYGLDVAIDASDLPAYANGQRWLYKGGPAREQFSDPDASWGHRSAISTRKGGGFYGYKLHAVVCARTDLPLAWRVESGRVQESLFPMQLLGEVRRRGFEPDTAAMDKAYDHPGIYDACHESGCIPIVPLRMTPDVVADPYEAPECEHGLWTFAGAEFKNRRTKWRCPSGECSPKSTWRKASRRNPLIPRKSDYWRKLYFGRGSVERNFARLKQEFGLTPLRVRGQERVALHADLCILTRLSLALTRARAAPFAA
jgi:Transposase DDE domain